MTGEQTDAQPAEKSAALVRERVEAVYRAESRRVFATLVRLLGDFDRAEEALHEAFISAVEQWGRDGVPENPRAWLVSAGRVQSHRCHPPTGRREGLQQLADYFANDEKDFPKELMARKAKSVRETIAAIEAATDSPTLIRLK